MKFQFAKDVRHVNNFMLFVCRYTSVSGGSLLNVFLIACVNLVFWWSSNSLNCHNNSSWKCVFMFHDPKIYIVVEFNENMIHRKMPKPGERVTGLINWWCGYRNTLACVWRQSSNHSHTLCFLGSPYHFLLGETHWGYVPEGYSECSQAGNGHLVNRVKLQQVWNKCAGNGCKLQHMNYFIL